jgi:preprotein translocase subunit SecY
MASAAEQLAANINFGAIAKAEELKKRIWFTLGALLVYRLGTYIPMPGIDPEALRQSFQNASGGVLGLFNMFSAAPSSAWRSSLSTSCRTSRHRSSSSC